MTKNQIIFYIGIALATIATEISMKSGFVFCAFPLSMLIVAILALRAFPAPPKETK